MIKALLLIFDPVATWDRIIRAKRSVPWILGLYLLPMVALSVAVELYGILQWGRHQMLVPGVKHISHELALVYGVAQFVMSLVAVFLVTWVIKTFGGTFHSRHRFPECFTVVAYSLSPVFLLRLLDAYPVAWWWWLITLGIGVTLSVAVLYSGLPRVLEPDPPQAFGLYVTSAVLLIIIVALSRTITWMLLEGKFKIH